VTETVRIKLKPGRDKALRQGHPWLFSGAVAGVSGPPSAPIAVVEDAAGRPIGSGFYSPRSQIRVRLLRHDDGPVDRRLFRTRLQRALALRRALVPPETTGYRLVNAEGDGLPGWTVDRYGDLLVSQITAAGLEALRDEAYAALDELLPGLDLVQKNRSRARRREGLPQADEQLRGEPREEALFRESGLAFSAELGGQKTGFYLDQRDNRRLAESLAGGRSVLDLFAHGGAFSLYALRGGAAAVTAVESSPRLIARGRADLERNPELPAARLSWVRANVFEDLRQRRERYDLVICDPPSLVEKRSDKNAGARAYKDLNRLALARVAGGGFLLTFSCSAAVDARLFRQILFAAATEARVHATLLRPLAAAADHPIAITHPQGEYLKGWLLHVPGPAD